LVYALFADIHMMAEACLTAGRVIVPQPAVLGDFATLFTTIAKSSAKSGRWRLPGPKGVLNNVVVP
jgi:hypothetical protein